MDMNDMIPTIAATVIGVLLSVAFGALVTMLAWLRSDTNARLDKMDDKVDARFDKVDEKFDMVDGRDGTRVCEIMSLIICGHHVDRFSAISPA